MLLNLFRIGDKMDDSLAVIKKIFRVFGMKQGVELRQVHPPRKK